ncbi:hypothetical protein ACFWQD_03375 [Alcaligenes faecalis]|uniref:hypothetical protein n=1 Tax=Alcaligenes faecalis TaxID=511 RepID=UPI00365305CE
MDREVVIYENRFIEILTDALMLYEAAEKCESIHAKEALVRSCVLSICFSLEAAANSFLRAVECDDGLKKKIDRFSTLDKFDFVLQWGQGCSLKKGESRYQRVRFWLTQRDGMAHPKISRKSAKVNTTLDDTGTVVHTELQGGGGANSQFTFDLDYAKDAFKAMVNFLNGFVEEWWAGGREAAEEYLFPTWNGSLNARNIMLLPHQLDLLIKHNGMLNIKFIGIYGLLPGQEYS